MQESFITPIPSTNQLVDVIGWVRNGDIVVIFNDNNVFRIFYKSNDSIDNLTDKRIMMINCQSVPGICDDGEWNYYITQDGNIESNSIDLLQKIKVLIGNKSPNVFSFIT
jgi:hypothetical protein